MGDVVLNVSLAVIAGLIGGLVTYYFPASVASFVDMAFYKIFTPFRWIIRPFLRFMDVIDRE
jgi:hypothetical protein